ncbi:MAG: STAS-like domain-containing protein [Paludibacteraceae bacterium]|nr:STAS-like domain-containing protein [Paludibacteraceae bacterium]
MAITVSILKDFSRIPGPRYVSEGKFSGEQFRKEVLVQKVNLAMESDCEIIIDLDGVSGYGTSFLEEAFGGLIREEHIPYEFLKSKLKLKSEEDPDYVDEIWEDIENAHKEDGK